MTKRRPILLVLALCVGASASAQAQDATHSATPGGQQTTGATALSEDEREALGMLSAINTSEINAASLALQKQVQGGARDYATRMLKGTPITTRRLPSGNRTLLQRVPSCR